MTTKTYVVCPRCDGEKFVNLLIDGFVHRVSCPLCKGDGTIGFENVEKSDFDIDRENARTLRGDNTK